MVNGGNNIRIAILRGWLCGLNEIKHVKHLAVSGTQDLTNVSYYSSHAQSMNWIKWVLEDSFFKRQLLWAWAVRDAFLEGERPELDMKLKNNCDKPTLSNIYSSK